jgi:hypothetical protein
LLPDWCCLALHQRVGDESQAMTERSTKFARAVLVSFAAHGLLCMPSTRHFRRDFLALLGSRPLSSNLLKLLAI